MGESEESQPLLSPALQSYVDGIRRATEAGHGDPAVGHSNVTRARLASEEVDRKSITSSITGRNRCKFTTGSFGLGNSHLISTLLSQ